VDGVGELRAVRDPDHDGPAGQGSEVDPDGHGPEWIDDPARIDRADRWTAHGPAPSTTM
jgi:hypothetical protein